MTDRDRLIELHHEAGVEWDCYLFECIDNDKMPSKTYDEFHADYLLANGVVKVVRCKDCDYFEIKNSLGTQGICKCGEIETNYGGELYLYANDFCSYGKLKELKDNA